MAASSLFHAARGRLMSYINRFGGWYSPAHAPHFDVNAPQHRFVQWIGRMYAKLELPRHVHMLEVLQVGREPLWVNESWRECRGCWHGYRMRLNVADFYQRWAYFLSRYHEMPLQILMRHAIQKGDVYIDGGANNGLVTMVGAWLVGRQGVVHAFEPNINVYNQLAWHVNTNKLAHVRAHQAGVSDVEETLTLRVPGSGNWGAGTFSALPDRYGGEFCESCTAQTIIGDSLIPTLPPSAEVFLKLDVEGFELRALKGFDRMLRDSKPLVAMELNAEMLGMNGVKPEDVFDFMESRGYKCFGFEDTRKLVRRHGIRLFGLTRESKNMPPDVAWIHPQSGMWKRLQPFMQ